MGNMDDPGADWNNLARENAALRKRVEEAEAKSRYWWAEAEDLRHQREDLRKRVEELEISAGSAAMTIRMAQARAEKAELELFRAIPIYEEALTLARERAEKAERERDELMENHQALGREYEAQGRVADKLQADLTTALDWIEKETCPVADFQMDQKILDLLEKRREKRG